MGRREEENPETPCKRLLLNLDGRPFPFFPSLVGHRSEFFLRIIICSVHIAVSNLRWFERGAVAVFAFIDIGQLSLADEPFAIVDRG